jgi:hypothetical protein
VETYTRTDRVKAINWAALLGWASFALEYLFQTGNPFGLLFFALYGLPISFALVWSLAGPVVWLAMRRSVSWFNALALGVSAAAVMAAIGFTWKFWSRWQANHNPNFSYQSGGGDYVRDIDGILTSYGQWMELQETVRFVLIGAIVALAVRKIIGPARYAKPRSL